ncbi:MAG: hypothetical protein N2445_02400, partial [Acidobacteria bacterium]|nr:hypothetical protein [Acidobacteriota bacterium]
MFKSFFLAVVTVIIFAASVSFSATDLKDTPYFSGMAEYKIVEAIDQDFSDYRFYNGKDCITVEGAKYYRAYSLKENGKQASELQIARNYSNALNNMGGEILFDGICSGSDCAENCGSRMMVGKIAKEGSEIWLEV